MNESFSNIDKVPAELLQERLKTVKELESSEFESYDIMKDEATGEHYLHYAYLHRDIATGGKEEEYHQLMAIDSDDVLGVLFNSQPYRYPDHWTRAFLRNGASGVYVWFDPGDADELAQSERIGQSIVEKLKQLKASGQFDAESMDNWLKDLDKKE